ncbi:MAG: DUF2752 domain-containing protein [Bacteroidetes bacterium]|nr:DUF2752 domain-containing protein [Bacteroidota bacterium]
MQRALIALLKGDLEESLQLNVTLIPFLITVFYVFGHLVFSFKNGARYIIVLVLTTASISMVNFVIKLISHS